MTVLSPITIETFDSHVVSLLDKLDHVRGELRHHPTRAPMDLEVRRLEFWRAVLCECVGTLLFVFLVCSASLPWSPLDTWAPQRLYAAATTAGVSMAVLTQCLWRCSGAHFNPAITVAAAVVGHISPLRCLIYVAAQCGGSVAGATLLYGSSTPSVQGSLGVTLVTPPLSAWQGFGNEFVMSFIVALVFFNVTDPCRRPLGMSSLIIGLSYMAVSLAGVHSTGASMNPARSLGPAFVMDIWNDHWVYWVAPVLAATLAAMLHGRMFNTYGHQANTRSVDLDSAASRSERECLDDEPDTNYAPHSAIYNDTLRSQRHLPVTQRNYNGAALLTADCRSVCAANEACTSDARSIYGGTKSLYGGVAGNSRDATKEMRINVANAGVTRSQSMYMRERHGDWLARATQAEQTQLTADKRTLSSYVCMSSPRQAQSRPQPPHVDVRQVPVTFRQMPPPPPDTAIYGYLAGYAGVSDTRGVSSLSPTATTATSLMSPSAVSSCSYATRH